MQRDDGSWLLDGLIPIPELKDLLDLSSVPEEGHSHYHTLSGLVMQTSGKLPQTGDHCQWEIGNWKSSTWMACASIRFLQRAVRRG